MIGSKWLKFLDVLQTGIGDDANLSTTHAAGSLICWNVWNVERHYNEFLTTLQIYFADSTTRPSNMAQMMEERSCVQLFIPGVKDKVSDFMIAQDSKQEHEL